MTEPLDPDAEPTLIDVRSPGERMADSGRAGFERVRVALDGHLVADLALVWMVALLLIVASNVYSAFDYARQATLPGGPSLTWLRLSLLAGTATLSIVAISVIGLGLAALAGSWLASRAAIWIGVVLSVWIVIAGACGVAVAIHGGEDLSIPRSNRFVYAVSESADIALGLVVGGLAAVAAAARDDLDYDDEDEDLAELS